MGFGIARPPVAPVIDTTRAGLLLRARSEQGLASLVASWEQLASTPTGQQLRTMVGDDVQAPIEAVPVELWRREMAYTGVREAFAMGYQGTTLPQTGRILLRGDVLADAQRGGSLLGHELVHRINRQLALRGMDAAEDEGFAYHWQGRYERDAGIAPASPGLTLPTGALAGVRAPHEIAELWRRGAR